MVGYVDGSPYVYPVSGALSGAAALGHGSEGCGGWYVGSDQLLGLSGFVIACLRGGAVGMTTVPGGPCVGGQGSGSRHVPGAALVGGRPARHRLGAGSAGKSGAPVCRR